MKSKLGKRVREAARHRKDKKARAEKAIAAESGQHADEAQMNDAPSPDDEDATAPDTSVSWADDGVDDFERLVADELTKWIGENTPGVW